MSKKYKEIYDRELQTKEWFVGKKLGGWLNTQRTVFKQGKFSQEKIDKPNLLRLV